MDSKRRAGLPRLGGHNRGEFAEHAAGFGVHWFGPRIPRIHGGSHTVYSKDDRVLKFFEINCALSDPYGQVVLREQIGIAGKKTGDLRPGETKNFRLAFDSNPQSWNNPMPDLVIAQILFG